MAAELTIGPQAVVDMANEMPIELVCVLAHQCDRWVLSPVEVERLLQLFPEERFASIKRAIRTDYGLSDAFKVAMLQRLRAASHRVNYVTHPNKMQITADGGLVWAYGDDGDSVFEALDATNTEHARRVTLAPNPK